MGSVVREIGEMVRAVSCHVADSLRALKLLVGWCRTL
jgi:hypothetical protein